MKIQCSCGAKYEFEVTPDMAQRPVQFTCPSCGGDLSESLTNLVRAELAQGASSVAQVIQSPQLAAHSPLRVHLQRQEPNAPQTAPEEGIETTIEEQRCPKHPAEL